MLTSMQAFELIENNYSCRKSANRPVYKLSVDNNDNNQKKKKRQQTKRQQRQQPNFIW